MSARTVRAGTAVPAIGLVFTGCALLASRALLSPPSGATRPVLGAVIFGSILAASLLAPAAHGPERLRPAAVLAVGLGAVALAAAVAGTPVPLVAAAWTLPLSLLAAVAEEALFRRVAYAQLERWGVPVAIVGSAALFALVHLPLYGTAALPVDLGAGLVFGWQRWASGSWTVPAATHAAANLVAVIR